MLLRAGQEKFYHLILPWNNLCLCNSWQKTGCSTRSIISKCFKLTVRNELPSGRRADLLEACTNVSMGEIIIFGPTVTLSCLSLPAENKWICWAKLTGCSLSATRCVFISKRIWAASEMFQLWLKSVMYLWQKCTRVLLDRLLMNCSITTFSTVKRSSLIPSFGLSDLFLSL